MKILRNIIFALVTIAIVLAFVIGNYSNNTMVDEKNVSSITIINIHREKMKYLAAQAKEIKNQEDIKAICDAFNSAKSKEIEESQLRSGGGGYIFIFNYSTGLHKMMIYIESPYLSIDGPYLRIDEKYYKIYSNEFEKFWDLDYPIKDWHFNADGSMKTNSQGLAVN